MTQVRCLGALGFVLLSSWLLRDNILALVSTLLGLLFSFWNLLGLANLHNREEKWCGKMRVAGSHQIDTLNSPVGVGHRNSLKPTLLFYLLQISNWKLVWATFFIFSRTLMWVPIFFYVTFVLELILKVLVRSLQEDLGEDSGSWTSIISNLTIKLVWPTLIFHSHY